MSDDSSSQSSTQDDSDFPSEGTFNSEVFDQIRDILDENLNIRGTMVYFQTYGSDAPNPCINIKGFGPVGFPLSTENARTLMEFPQFTDNNSTRDFDRELVEPHNPVWDQWIQNTVLVEACARLGLSNDCKCELDKMTLQSLSPSTAENASCTSTLQSEASQNHNLFFLPRSTRMVQLGCIEILLPSQFTGGDVTVAYPTMPSYPEKLTQWSEHSELSTAVLGTRCGYVKTVAPLQAGYRASLQPVFDPVKAVARLRETLAPQTYPPGVIAINLCHKYDPSDSFCGSSLTGPDDVLLSCIRAVADAFKLKLLVANIVHQRREYSYILGRDTWEDDESDDAGNGQGDEEYEDEVQVDLEATRTRRALKPRFNSDAELFSFIERHQSDNETDFTEDSSFYRGIEIQQLVDLDGMPVTIDLKMEASDIIHDAGYGQGYSEYDNGYSHDHFWEDENRGEPDIKVFEGSNEDVSVSGYVKQEWKGTVLLICQKWIRIGPGDDFECACHRLERSNSASATSAENLAAEFLMEWCEDEPDQQVPDDDANKEFSRAASALARCAVMWNDIELFSRIIRECVVMTDVAGCISIPTFVAAYEKFFWVNVEEWLIDIITSWETSGLSYELVSAVMHAAIAKGDASAIEGCREKEDLILFSLKPVNTDEVPWLVDVAKERGVEFFRDHVLSSLQQQTLCVRFWLDLGREIWSAEDTFSSSNAFPAFISDITSLCAQKFTSLEDPDHTGFDRCCSSATKMNINLVVDILTLCVQTGNMHHCGMVLEQMMSWANRNDAKGLLPWQYYNDLAGKLDELLRSHPNGTTSDLNNPWTPFFRAAAEISIMHSRLDDDILATISISLNRAGGVLALKSIMDAEGIAYMAVKKKGSLKRLIVHMHTNLLTPEASTQTRRDLDDVLTACVSAVIKHFDFAGLSDVSGDEAVNKVIAFLKFSFDAGVGVHCYPAILDQLLSSAGITQGELHRTYLTDVLVLLIDPLRTVLIDLGISMTEGPIKSFCSVVTRLFVSKVVGKKPAETKIPDITTFGCGCPECGRIKDFLQSGPTVSLDIHELQRVRIHAETKLQAVGAKKWGVEWRTVRGTLPQKLRISKPEWLAHRQQGLNLLDSLGDAETQNAVLGKDLSWILGTLDGSLGPNDIPLPMKGIIPGPAYSSAGRKRSLNDSEDGPSSIKKQKTSDSLYE
ncbi:hypothetical protein IW261DRAFT_1489878 [Armillaria novae-zelandiae]|uniref:Uncharacterized protein n=1 Tax=Armillaria novae-zelandiae TaxID=153914 RepID=A0AA39P388_9AGAR|nr:hypothetical protein IW261DRAFT_1489878 [Armillaria novae-zelandiae]